MAQYFEGNPSFVAGEALKANRRVKLDANDTIVYADAADGDNWIGFTVNDIESGGLVTVRMRNCPGTFFVTAAGAITALAALYPADDGKVDDLAVAGVPLLGLRARFAASADGNIIEAIEANSGSALVPQTVTLGNANGAIAGLTIGGTYSQSEVQALRAACETLADDVRAIYAALQANGILA